MIFIYNKTQKKALLLVLGLIALLLSACSTIPTVTQQDGAPKTHVDISKIPNAKPKVEPRSRYGNPASYKVFGVTYHVKHSANNYKERGIASWYGTKFHHRSTSSGEPYSMFKMTAAHKTLPIPCYARVTNLENGRRIIVKINDRGPFHANRIIDLSYVAAKKLDISSHGTGLVEVETINPLTYHKKKEATVVAHHRKPILYLQVGAYSQRANADRQAQHIARITHEQVHLVHATYRNRPLYRVQIGPLHDVEASDRVHNKLKHAGVGNAIAVVQ